MNKRKRLSKKTRSMVIAVVSIMCIMGLILFLIDNQEELQNQKEQIEKNYERLQLDFAVANQQIEELKTENEKLTEQLADQKRVVPEGWQPFYGLWLSVNCYKAYSKGVQECWKEIKIHHNYISLTGKNNLTDEPVFDIAVRIRSDVIDEIKAVGVEDEDLINMLQAECYAEMDFNSIHNWKRELLPGEVDLIENAKYYILDNQTMLCVSQNDGGKVYVFSRSTY